MRRPESRPAPTATHDRVADWLPSSGSSHLRSLLRKCQAHASERRRCPHRGGVARDGMQRFPPLRQSMRSSECVPEVAYSIHPTPQFETSISNVRARFYAVFDEGACNRRWLDGTWPTDCVHWYTFGWSFTRTPYGCCEKRSRRMYAVASQYLFNVSLPTALRLDSYPPSLSPCITLRHSSFRTRQAQRVCTFVLYCISD